MTFWQVTKALVKSTGFYTRQFIFFAALALIGTAAFFSWHYYPYMAQTTVPATPGPGASNQTYNLTVTSDGKVVDREKTVSLIELGKEKDTLRYLILSQPDTFVDYLQVNVHFEPSLPIDKIAHRPIATHYDSGIGSQVSSYFVDNHTLVYSGTGLGPDTIFTIYAQLPKEIIRPPWWRQAVAQVSQFSLATWFIVALLLPLLTLSVLVALLIHRYLNIHISPAPLVKAPPGKLPPAIVGILIRNRIGAREIAATIIDLAAREYLYIYQEGGNFFFGRGRALESEKIYELLPYEKLLLTKIFSTPQAKSSLAELDVRLGRQLFSRKIAQVFLELYKSLGHYEYFEENPGLVHQKYKLVGFGLLLVGFAGFALNTAFNQKAPFLLLFWAGMLVAASMIIYLSRQMPILTPKGGQERRQWIGFRRFLLQQRRFTHQEELKDPYINYLAYAIVLGVETTWTKKFYKSPFHLPKWFDSNQQVASIEDFANALFPLIGFIAHNLITARTPIID